MRRLNHKGVKMEETQKTGIFRSMVDAVLVGGLAGLFSTFYRFLIHQIGPLRAWLYQAPTPRALFVALALAASIAFIIHWLLKWAPLSGGSGIPQIAGELHGQFDMAAGPTICSKIVGGGLGSFIGFSLGREGPSIQMGGAGAKKLAHLLKRSPEEEKTLLTAGAAAGLAAAFNAPLAGCIFAIEELHKRYSHQILLPALIASCVANAVSFLLLGQETAFRFAAVESLPIALAFVPILIGFLTGLVGALYNQLILRFQDLFAALGRPVLRYALLMGIALVIGFLVPDMTGGGHNVLEKMALGLVDLKTLSLILLIKLFYTTFCYGSGVQGGIFLPVLVIGGACGGLVFWLLQKGLRLDAYYVNFLILGMSGILASVVRSPLLSVVLVSEMTSTYKHLWALSLVVVISYYVALSLRSAPIYDSLLDRLLAKPELRSDLEAGQRADR